MKRNVICSVILFQYFRFIFMDFVAKDGKLSELVSFL